jgi:hypothetical protein
MPERLYTSLEFNHPSPDRRERINAHLKEGTDKGWRLEHVAESQHMIRFPSEVAVTMHSFFWIRDE